MDIQYIIFVRHITGQSIQSSTIKLFIIIFILSCCSLALVPGLIFLIIKNESKANKVMNAFLSVSFISAFIFCFYLNSYWGGNTDSKVGTEITFLIALVSIAAYAVLKVKCMPSISTSFHCCSSKTIIASVQYPSKLSMSLTIL